VSITGGTASHKYEVNGVLEGYFWVCSCGQSTSPIYGSASAARDSAERHVTSTPPGS